MTVYKISSYQIDLYQWRIQDFMVGDELPFPSSFPFSTSAENARPARLTLSYFISAEPAVSIFRSSWRTKLNAITVLSQEHASNTPNIHKTVRHFEHKNDITVNLTFQYWKLVFVTSFSHL